MRDKSFREEEAELYGSEEWENEGKPDEKEYLEETAGELAPRIGTLNGDIAPNMGVDEEVEDNEAVGNNGRGMGMLALVLSIISLFIAPILLGAAGLIIGFIARRRGAETTGNWAIGIGAVSLIVSLFIAPFFF